MKSPIEFLAENKSETVGLWLGGGANEGFRFKAVHMDNHGKRQGAQSVSAKPPNLQ